MGEWKKYKLGEIATKIGSGATPLGGKESYLESGDFSLIRSQNVLDFSFSKSGLAFLSEEQANGLKNVEVEENDILLNITGDSVARVCQVPSDILPARVNQHVAIIRGKNEIIDQQFLKYYLLQPSFKRYMLGLASAGATRNALTKSMIESFEILAPDLPTQRQIAQILSSLDDKIELNLQMNQTLEAMAQTIFKEWFVNFNFPGFDGELVDGLPKGWRMGKLGDVITFVKGKKPDDVSIEKQEGYLPQILIDTFNTSNSVFANPNKMVIASQEEMLMVMDGASSGRIEIGHAGIVGSTIAKIVLKNQFAFPLYIYFFLKTKEKDIMGNTTGSSIPHADKNKILDYDFVVPDKNTSRLFEQAANSLLEKIKINKSENKTLTQLRDTLLPRLMSGQLEVAI